MCAIIIAKQNLNSLQSLTKMLANGLRCRESRGFQIDENLTWKNQIKSVTEKASRAIGFLKYAKNLLPDAVVKTLYNSIVEPHFQGSLLKRFFLISIIL